MVITCQGGTSLSRKSAGVCACFYTLYHCVLFLLCLCTPSFQLILNFADWCVFKYLDSGSPANTVEFGVAISVAMMDRNESANLVCCPSHEECSLRWQWISNASKSLPTCLCCLFLFRTLTVCTLRVHTLHVCTLRIHTMRVRPPHVRESPLHFIDVRSCTDYKLPPARPEDGRTETASPVLAADKLHNLLKYSKADRVYETKQPQLNELESERGAIKTNIFTL